MTDEKRIISGLRDRDIRAFKALVYDYSDEMIAFAYLLLNDRIRATIIVDSILLALRSADEVNPLTAPLGTYLRNQVREACKLNNPISRPKDYKPKQ